MSVVGSDWWRFSTLSRRINSSSWSDTSQSGGSVSDSTCQSNKTNSTLYDTLRRWNSGIYIAPNNITHRMSLSVSLFATEKINTNFHMLLWNIKGLNVVQILQSISSWWNPHNKMENLDQEKTCLHQMRAKYGYHTPHVSVQLLSNQRLLTDR